MYYLLSTTSLGYQSLFTLDWGVGRYKETAVETEKLTTNSKVKNARNNTS